MLTLNDCMTLLRHYEDMAVAARNNDWDRLVELETLAVAVRDKASGPFPPPPGEPQVQQEMAAAIQRILELDAEIRTHAEPFLESTRKLLSGSVQDRRVRTTYGALG